MGLPSVVEGAPRLLAEAGVAERCEIVGGAKRSLSWRTAAVPMAERGYLLLVEPVLPSTYWCAPAGASA